MDEDIDIDELEAMLDDSGDMGMDPTMDPDNPSTGVVTDINAAVRENLEASRVASVFGKKMMGELPGGVGDNAGEAVSAAGDVVDHAVEKFEKVKKATASTLGAVAEVTPDFIADPLKRMRRWIKGDSEFGSSAEPTEDQKILEQVAGILGEAGTSENIAAANQEQTAKMASMKDTALLRSIAVDSKFMATAKAADSKYYRKDLELQIKQTITMTKIYDLMSRDSTIRLKQFEAIVKNTALPDFSKSRPSDFIKQGMIKSATSAGTGLFRTTSIFNRAAKNMQRLLDDKINTFVNMTEQIEGGATAAGMAKDMGGGVLRSAMSFGVGGAVDAATEKGARFLLEEALKNDEGVSAVKDMQKYLSDPEAGFKYLKEQQEKKIADMNGEDGIVDRGKLTALETLSEVFSGGVEANNYNLTNTGNLDDAAQLDNRLKKSINTVIPDFLSKILSEVTTIRKGNNMVADEDRLSYNYEKNAFTDRATVKETVAKMRAERVEGVSKNIYDERTLSLLTDDSKLKPDEIKSILKGLVEYLSLGKTTSPYFMLENDLLKYIDGSAKGKVEKGLKNLLKSDNKKSIDELQELQRKITGMRDSTLTNYSDVVAMVEANNAVDVLTDTDLMDKTDLSNIKGSNMSAMNVKELDKAIDSMNFDKEEKTDKPGSFLVGGGTGEGEDDEIAGIVHKNEYVINSDKLDELIENISAGNTEKILEQVGDIVTGVTEQTDKITAKGVKDSIGEMTNSLANKTNKIVGDLTKDMSVLPNLVEKFDLQTTPSDGYNPLAPARGVSKLDTMMPTMGQMMGNAKQLGTNATDMYNKDFVPLINDAAEGINTRVNKVVGDLTKGITFGPNIVDKYNLQEMPVEGHNPLAPANTISKLDAMMPSKDQLTKNLDQLTTNLSGMYAEASKSLQNMSSTLGTTLDTVTATIGASFTAMSATASKQLDQVTTSAYTMFTETRKSVEGYLDNPAEAKKDFLAYGEEKYKNSIGFIASTFGKKKADKIESAMKSITGLGKYVPSSTDEAVEMIKALKAATPKDKKETLKMLEDSLEYVKDKSIDGGLDMLSILEQVSPDASAAILDGITSIAEVEKNTKVDESTTSKDTSKEKTKAGESFFDKLRGMVASTTTELTTMLNTTKRDPELLNSINQLDEIIETDGLENVIATALSTTVLPERYDEAKYLYQSIFNTIDPSGKLWETVMASKNGIPELMKMHETVLENKQKGIISLRSDDLVDDQELTMMGKIKKKLLSIVPEPVKAIVKSAMDSKLGKYFRRTGSKIKDSFMKAGGVMKDTFKGIGQDGVDMFKTKNGNFKMANLLDMAKFSAKSSGKLTMGLSKSVKELYPELFGLAGDAIVTGAKVGGDFLGVNRAVKGATAKTKAFFKPPVKRELYKAWSSGDLTGEQVMDQLETPEEKLKWERWLAENIQGSGITLGDVMATSGKWFVKSIAGTSKVIDPAYKKAGSGLLGGVKFAGKVGLGLFGINMFKDPEQEEGVDENDPSFIGPRAPIPETDNAIAEEVKESLTSTAETNTELVEVGETGNGILDNILTGLSSLVETYTGKPVETKEETPKEEKSEEESRETALEELTEEFKTTAALLRDDKEEPDEVATAIEDQTTITEDIAANTKKMAEALTATAAASVNSQKTFSPFDKDKDGDRDGNSKDRMAKLYGKKDSKDKPAAKDSKPSKEGKSSTSWGWLVGLAGMLTPILTGLFKSFISEPIMALGGKITSAITSGISKAWTGTKEYLGKKLKGITDGVKAIGTKVADGFKSAKDAVVDKAKNAYNAVKDKTTKVVDNVKKLATGAKDKALGWFEAVGKKASGAYNAVKTSASKVVDGVASKSKYLIKKIRVLYKLISKKVIKKLGVKAGGKILAKVGSKFIPGIGQALLAYDASMIGYAMTQGVSFKQATSEQLLGFNVFDDDSVAVDADGKPIKPDIVDSNEEKYEPTKEERSKQFDSTKTASTLADELRKRNDKSKEDKTQTSNEGEPAPKGTAPKAPSKIPIKPIIFRDTPAYDPSGGLDNLLFGKNVSVDGLNPAMKNNLFAMANEYNDLTGEKLLLNSAYRSTEYQRKLRARLGNKAARPGYSTHEFGLAVDVNKSTLDKIDSLGLLSKYKFTRPIGGEGWHLEPAGIQTDVNAAKHDPELAATMIDGAPHGGSGWGLEKNVRHYSRNKQYQEAVLTTPPTKVISAKVDKQKIAARVEQDKPKVNKATKVANQTKVATTLPTGKKSTSTVPARKDGKATQPTKPPVVNIDTSSVNSKKELKDLTSATDITNRLIDQSLVIQQSMDNRLGELVELNKGILASLSSPDDSRLKQANQQSYSKPAPTPLATHKTKYF